MLSLMEEKAMSISPVKEGEEDENDKTLGEEDPDDARGPETRPLYGPSSPTTTPARVCAASDTGKPWPELEGASIPCPTGTEVDPCKMDSKAIAD
jgi:hypothetical protein